MPGKQTYSKKLPGAGFAVPGNGITIVGAAVTIAENNNAQFGTDPSGAATLLDVDNRSALSGVAVFLSDLNIDVGAGETLYLQSSGAGSGVTILFVLK